MEKIGFRVMGFDVEVRPGFLVLAGLHLLFGLQHREPAWSIASFIAVMFVSILVHELGHATMARRLRIPVYEVVLWGLGGYVRHAPSTPRNNLLVSLAGPGIELAMGLPVLALYLSVDLPDPVRTVAWHWCWINVGWAVINLLPMFPLDGGNALSAYLAWKHTTAERARRLTAQIGVGVSAAVGAAGLLLLGSLFFALFGAYLASINYRTWRR